MRLPRRKRTHTPEPAEAPGTPVEPTEAEAPGTPAESAEAETPRTPVESTEAEAPPTAETPLAPAGVEDDWVHGGAPRRHWAGMAATCVVLIAVLAAVGLAQTSAGHTVLRKAGLAETARPFTELYFLHPRHIPLEVIKQSPHQRVSFVVRNQEHRQQTYSWTIGTKGSAPAASGTVRLYVGHWATIDRRVRIDCTGRRAYEQVSLTGRGETIGYWLTCRSLAPTKKKKR